MSVEDAIRETLMASATPVAPARSEPDPSSILLRGGDIRAVTSGSLRHLTGVSANAVLTARFESGVPTDTQSARTNVAHRHVRNSEARFSALIEPENAYALWMSRWRIGDDWAASRARGLWPGGKPEVFCDSRITGNATSYAPQASVASAEKRRLQALGATC